MNGKNLDVSVLLDFYGELLTEKQRDAIELYYNEDLSLAEISEHQGISRQGVRDAIKRGEATLLELESKLGLSKKFFDTSADLEKALRLAEEIKRCNDKSFYSLEINKKVEEIFRILTPYVNE